MTFEEIARRLRDFGEPILYGAVWGLIAWQLYAARLLESWIGWLLLTAATLTALWLGRAWRRDRALASAESAGPGIVEVSERRIGYLTAEGGGYVSIDELAEVDIMTTSDGPWGDDFFWIFRPLDAASLAIPNSAVGAENIIPALEALPNVDYRRVLDASGSTDDATFVIWRRQGETAGQLASLAKPD